MIFALIIFLAFVVFLAFFFGLNIGNACNFWFFKTYTEVPVAVLLLVAFGAGIVIAMLFMLIAKLRGPSEAEKERREELALKREAARAKAEAKSKKLMEKQHKLAEKKRKESEEKAEAFAAAEVPTVTPVNADNKD